MSKSPLRYGRDFTAVIAIACAFGLVAGCGKKADAPAGAPAVLGSSDSILRYIPGDTPYVIVNAEPIDDDIVEKMMGETSAMVSSYEIVIKEAFLESIEEYPEDDPEREEAERNARMMGQVLELFTLDGMRDAGFDINESVALYGHGLLPVLRAKLIDRAAFERAIVRLEAEAGAAMQTAEVEGQVYRYTEGDEGRVVLGAFGDSVVLTFLPDIFGDEELAILAGLELPATNLAETGTLSELASEYGFTSHYLGFIDVRRIAGTIVEDASGLDAMLLAESEFEREELSDVCREEIMAAADVAPRAVFGYSKIERDGVAGSFVVELRDDIATGLTALQTAVPGLGKDLGGLMSFGLGLDPIALREFYSARLDALEADPFECEHFADVQAGVANGRAALAQPVPPVAYGFRGFVGVIDDVDMAALAQNVPPTDLDATFMIAIENAPQLMMMGSMFSPELAELDVQPDGKPVALAVPQAAMLPSVPYAALTDDLLAVSMGGDAESRIEDLMTAPVGEPGPLVSIAGDAGRYYDMVGQAMLEDDDTDEISPAAREAIADSMTSLGEVYDRIQFDMRFTERGVEIDTAMSFKD